MNAHRFRIAVAVAAVLAAAACGQKPGVGSQQAAAGSPLGVGQESGPVTPETAPPAGGVPAAPEATAVPASAPAAAPATPAPTPTATPGPGGSRVAAPAAKPSAPAPGTQPGAAPAAAPAPSGGKAGGPAPAGPPAGQPQPGGQAPAPAPVPAPAQGPVDRTGVADDVIKIGVHAPVTGAAPIPQNSFDKAKDIYWKYLNAKGGVHGRRVEVIFRDDQYNPARAVQVCREMVEQEKVFLLIGVAGSEQLTACANYANSLGVPYLSGGNNEDGLTGLSTYFAISQSFDQQAPIIAGMIKKELAKTKVAVVSNATPALNESHRRAIEATKAAGLTVVRNSRIGKNASDSELLAEANQLKASGAEVVYVLTAPVNFIKLATHTRAQAYNPTFAGPGPSNGLNLVAEAGCPSINGARFLSSFPQLDVIDKFDADFRPAYSKHAGGEADDIALLSWGLSKVIAKMFETTGRDLSRQSLMATLTSGVEFDTGVYPTVKFSPTMRFGAKASHILEADCSRRQYRTVHTFVEAF